MSNIIKKDFNASELKWGAIKRLDGVSDNKAQFTFFSYIVFFIDEKGKYRNVVNQNEIYDNIDNLLSLPKDMVARKGIGKSYIDTISENAWFILYRAFDISKKNKYSVKEVEDAILSCDMLFFKDREKIEIKRDKAKQKVKIL